MPHLVLRDEVDFDLVLERMSKDAVKWGAAVLKTTELWRRADGRAILIEGVVIEHSRPLHPVALISLSHGDTSVRLWRLAAVERTPAVQRWLAVVARDLQQLGAGPVRATNIAPALVEDLRMSPG
jgi:hypothetical protein